MAENTPSAQGQHSATDQEPTNAALQAFERLTIQSQTPVKTERPSSRPSSRPTSSHTVSTSGAPLDNASFANGLRRSSSSFTPIGNTASPPLSKRQSTSSLKGAHTAQTFPAGVRFSASRRPSSSLQSRPVSSGSLTGGISLDVEPHKPRTAATVGAEYFARELAAHATAHGNCETVIILHEACYGHRFSRPRTSKAALSTIVERPERITAALLGVSTAYVRLGGRYHGGNFAPAPGDVKLGQPPFAIRRSTRSIGLLSPSVVAVHGLDWMNELQSICLAAGARLALDGKELLRPQKTDPMGRPVETQQFHEGDLYLCEESLDALQGALGGVCDAVDAVFSDSLTRRAFVAVRPPGHHCSADFPSGFCWLNNVHVGIQHAAQMHGLTHAVILDFDLHHGDGSQDITWTLNENSAAAPKNAAHNKKVSIGYYSLHDINSYPCEMGDKEKVQNASLCIDNAHGQSIWNVHLEPWSSEADFMRLYETKYAIIFEKARSFLQKQTAKIRAAPKGGQPRSAVFISAGFDASQWEGAGMQRHAVNVPTSFYERFTKDAVAMAHAEGTAAEGRVVSVMEGGYSNRALTSGVLSHVSGLSQPVGSQIGTSSNGTSQQGSDAGAISHIHPCDTRWWNSEALNALESYEANDVALPKKVRTSGYVPTFASPTESFSNKVVDPEKFHRSMSGTMRPLSDFLDQSLPEVDWLAASHALQNLLVPTHRTTTSCRPEDLAASKIKKQRQSLGAVPLPADSTPGARQLRDRKAKAVGDGVVGVSSEDEGGARIHAISKGRRKTMDAPGVAAGDEMAVRPKRVSSRRSSAVGADFTSQVQETVPAVPSIPAAFAASAVATPKQTMSTKKTRKSPTKNMPNAHGVSLVKKETTQSPTPGANSSGGSARPTGPPSLKTESSNASFETAPSSAGDMDRLTSAVKRITLKVGSREEHDRRVREQLEAEKAAKAKPRGRPRKIETPKQTPAVLENILPVQPLASTQPTTSFRPSGMPPALPPTDLSAVTNSAIGSGPPIPTPIATAIASDTQQKTDNYNTRSAAASPERPSTSHDGQIRYPNTRSAAASPERPSTSGSGGRRAQSPAKAPISALLNPVSDGGGVRPPVFSSTGTIPFQAVRAAPDRIMGIGGGSAEKGGEGNGGRESGS